jgi:predicted transcriptional regulator
MRGFGELEAVVMERLWAAGGTGTVREVFDQLRAHRDIAYTTVQSTIDNLYRKGFLTRKREGRAYRYQTTASHAEHSATLMVEALNRDEDSEAVLSHFVGHMSDEEFTRLHAVLGQHSGRRR